MPSINVEYSRYIFSVTHETDHEVVYLRCEADGHSEGASLYV